MSMTVVIEDEKVTLRPGTPADAAALHALVGAHLEEGRLLPRTQSELAVHASRFVVVERGDALVGCAELAPLSSAVAEIRSLVVDARSRGEGVAGRMVAELIRHARREGFDRLCAFAHDPAFFVGRGFSIVPHAWVPEKIAHDCANCPLFRACGQSALILDLDEPGVWASRARALDDQAVGCAY
jgi:N-acetylglutamate synthase-like GNAT family acetyltransferase